MAQGSLSSPNARRARFPISVPSGKQPAHRGVAAAWEATPGRGGAKAGHVGRSPAFLPFCLFLLGRACWLRSPPSGFPCAVFLALAADGRWVPSSRRWNGTVEQRRGLRAPARAAPPAAVCGSYDAADLVPSSPSPRLRPPSRDGVPLLCLALGRLSVEV